MFSNPLRPLCSSPTCSTILFFSSPMSLLLPCSLCCSCRICFSSGPIVFEICCWPRAASNRLWCPVHHVCHGFRSLLLVWRAPSHQIDLHGTKNKKWWNGEMEMVKYFLHDHPCDILYLHHRVGVRKVATCIVLFINNFFMPCCVLIPYACVCWIVSVIDEPRFRLWPPAWPSPFSMFEPEDAASCCALMISLKTEARRYLSVIDPRR